MQYFMLTQIVLYFYESLIKLMNSPPIIKKRLPYIKKAIVLFTQSQFDLSM